MISLCDCLLVSIKLLFFAVVSFSKRNYMMGFYYLFLKKYKLSCTYMLPRSGFETSRVCVLPRTLPIPALMLYIHMKGTL